MKTFENQTKYPLRTQQPEETYCCPTMEPTAMTTTTASDLLENLIMTITSATLPKILNLINATTIGTGTTSDYYTTNFTDYYFDNTTEIFNYTVDYENITDNFILNTTDINYTFTDYVTSFLVNYTSDLNSSFSASTTERTFDETTAYEEFKTTLKPYFSTKEYDEELTTIYGNMKTTIDSTLTPISNKTKMMVKYLLNVTIIDNNNSNNNMDRIDQMNYMNKTRLRSLCWETMFGQELVKLTVMDLVMMIASTLAMEFFRGLFIRFFNRCWCWDLEKKFPQYADFKVAENILHLVNNQGNVWMGMFFSPGITLINVVKLYITMYIRSWAVLTCNIPHEVIFRASRSNNFYFALLLMMLFLCVLPVGYAIVWVKPSFHCGPFSKYSRIFHIFTITLRNAVPKTLHRALDYIASPGIVIPLLVLLILIIYYLVSLTNALREANNDLKIQLRRERTEERRKMFQIADRRRRGGSEGSSEAQNPFSKWKKLMESMPNTKSLDETPKDSENMEASPREEKIDPDKKGKFYQ